MPVTLKSPLTGDFVTVRDDEVQSFIREGYTPQTTGEGIARAASEGVREQYEGPLDTVEAFGKSALGAATFGLTDAIAADEEYKLQRVANPIATQAGSIVGSVAPALLSGGSGALGELSRLTPAGKVGSIGAEILEAGRGAGALRAAGAAAKAGALEGSLQGGGQYISEVALEDKPLSAEGFVGAMGRGAMFGGAIGGGLGIGEQALVRAKRLFPRHEVTKEAAAQTERAAAQEIDSAVRDSTSMQRAARDRLREIRVQKAEGDLATKAELDRVRIAREQERLAAESARREVAEVRLERAKNPPPRRARKAMEPEQAVADAARPGATPPSDLEAALAGTKARLDAGEALGDISRAADVEDALDDVVAKVDPEAASLVAASRKERMTRQEMDAWMGRMKGHADRAAKERGAGVAYEESLSGRPVAGVAPRKVDRISTPVAESAADEAARLSAFRDRELARPRLADEILAGKPVRGGASADEILEITRLQDAERAQMGLDIDARISALLRNKPDDIAEDLAEAAQVIGRHEEAAAELAEILGAAAPPSAIARAKGYRDAAGAQGEKLTAAAAGMADDVARVGAQDIGSAAAAGVPSQLGKAADLGAALEVLQMMGVAGLPSAQDVPVIGPILGLYLKARAAGAVFRRLGGKVPVTAETTIASRAASTRQRMTGAVQKMLDVGAKTTRRAAKASGSVAGVLSHKLFEDGSAPRAARKGGDVQELVQSRLDEIARAQRPGAVRDAVRRRMRPSDPGLEDQIVSTQERKLAFLARVAPRPTQLPTMLKGDGEWHVSKAEAAQFARYVEAADDPAGVLERLADHGDVNMEGVEVLREVYPALYQEARMQLMERAADLQAKLPYTRRIALSILFQVPVDGTMDPQYLAFLRSAAPGTATAQQQQPPAQGSPAPTPTVAGSVRAGDRAMTSLDRRAGA